MIATAHDTLPTPNQDWVPIAEASVTSGLSIRAWQIRAGAEARTAARGGRKPLAVKADCPEGKGKRIWWIHRSMHTKLTRYPDRTAREDRGRTALCAKYPQHHVSAAYRKGYWLERWWTLCEATRDARITEEHLAERIVLDARLVDGEAFRISYRTLRNWRKAYNLLGASGEIQGAEGLIHGCAGLDRADGTGSRSPDAIEHFYGLFHTENQLAVAVCHEMTLQEAKRRGWTWPESYAATTRWLREHDNLSVSFLLRCGRDAWCRRFMPHIEANYTLIEPGQMFQTDHHQCDFWVVAESGEELRPWLTVVQDMRSRAIVGWNLGPKPHQDAILAAYLVAFRDWAIPEILRIDNGKDFVSELLTGFTKAIRDRLRREHGRDWQRVLKRDAELVECVDPRFVGITHELGIKTIFAVPYAPWSKAATERWFGSFEGRCGKTFATYCGNAPDSRPECLQAIRRKGAAPTMDEARQEIADYIVEYHHRPHSAEDMAGRSPLEVWRTAQRLQRAGNDELLFLMQARGCYRVGKNGVAFKIGGVRLTYGAGCAALYRFTGRDVFVTIDPNDVSRCYAFTAEAENRRFIACLDANKRISPNASAEELRDANAAVGRQRKIMHQAGRSSATRTLSAVEELRAKRRERVKKLRATGTDDKAAEATIVPVRTGFEGSTKGARNAATAPRIDRRARDLTAAKAALGESLGLSVTKRRRRRVSDDVLRGPRIETTDVIKDDGTDDGKDAGQRPSDAFSLIAGADRHERKQT